MQNILLIAIILGAVTYLFFYFRKHKQGGVDMGLFDESHASCDDCILPQLVKNPH